MGLDLIAKLKLQCNTNQWERLFSVELYERDKRNVSLHSWGDGISPRTDNRERGEALLIDGIVSTYGIPSSIEGRGSLEKWEGEGEIIPARTRRKVSAACQYRLFTIAYICVMIVVGLMWQGWLI